MLSGETFPTADLEVQEKSPPCSPNGADGLDDGLSEGGSRWNRRTRTGEEVESPHGFQMPFLPGIEALLEHKQAGPSTWGLCAPLKGGLGPIGAPWQDHAGARPPLPAAEPRGSGPGIVGPGPVGPAWDDWQPLVVLGKGSSSTSAGDPADHVSSEEDMVEVLKSPVLVPPPPGLVTEGLDIEQKLRTHRAGLCEPCVFFRFKDDGCRMGDQCLRCHFCTAEEVTAKRKRIKAQVRQRKAQQARTGTEPWAYRRH